MRRTLAGILLLGSAAAAQDFQVGSRAKAMGGSYTAFGDDPVAVWTNPAGTSGQPSQFSLTYQSFVQYEYDDLGVIIPSTIEGDAEQGLLDPPISPSFAGVVVQLGDADLELAASLAYIRPFQIKYVYYYADPNLGDLVTQTDQQFSRIRSSFAAGVRLSESSPFFKKVSFGIGLDYVHTKYKELDQSPVLDSWTLVYEDSESSMGFGAGVLATVYQSDTFRVDAGAAYNSKVEFNFDADPVIYPAWDWPVLVSGGFAFYLLEGYPLRFTLDVQWIAWKDSVADPDPGFPGFDDTTSYSAGAEYRLELKSGSWVFARAGFKLYDTPWKEESDLPWVGDSQLRIDTDGDKVEILTLGLGLYWSRKNAEGDARLSGIDLAVELFGETDFLIGAGFTYQFD
jgi:hypothetical protein